MTDIVESAEVAPEPTYSFGELFETARKLGLLEGWRVLGDAHEAYDEGCEPPDGVALGPGISDLVYRYLMQDGARALREGLALWGHGHVNGDAYGELMRLAGGVAGADSARMTAQSLAPLVAHVNLVLAKGGSAKRIVVFAFTGDAHVIAARPADRVEELARLGLLA